MVLILPFMLSLLIGAMITNDFAHENKWNNFLLKCDSLQIAKVHVLSLFTHCSL